MDRFIHAIGTATFAVLLMLGTAAALGAVIKRGQEDRRERWEDHAQARPGQEPWNGRADDHGLRVKDPAMLKQVKVGDKVKFVGTVAGVTASTP
jgi:hypothetical protein